MSTPQVVFPTSFRALVLLSHHIPTTISFWQQLDYTPTVVSDRFAELTHPQAAPPLQILRHPSPPTPPPTSTSSFAASSVDTGCISFHVDDLQSVLTKLLAHGAIMDGSISFQSDGRRVAAVRSPDGTSLGLLERPL